MQCNRMDYAWAYEDANNHKTANQYWILGMLFHMQFMIMRHLIEQIQ